MKNIFNIETLDLYAKRLTNEQSCKLYEKVCKKTYNKSLNENQIDLDKNYILFIQKADMDEIGVDVFDIINIVNKVSKYINYKIETGRDILLYTISAVSFESLIKELDNAGFGDVLRRQLDSNWLKILNA